MPHTRQRRCSTLYSQHASLTPRSQPVKIKDIYSTVFLQTFSMLSHTCKSSHTHTQNHKLTHTTVKHTHTYNHKNTHTSITHTHKHNTHTHTHTHTDAHTCAYAHTRHIHPPHICMPTHTHTHKHKTHRCTCVHLPQLYWPFLPNTCKQFNVLAESPAV